VNTKFPKYVFLFQHAKNFPTYSVNLWSNYVSVFFYIFVYYYPIYIKYCNHARCLPLFVHWVRNSVDTHRLNVSWIAFRVAKSRISCSWACFLFSNYWLSKLQLYLWILICYRISNFIIPTRERISYH
jgi:hypothetical protein